MELKETGAKCGKCGNPLFTVKHIYTYILCIVCKTAYKVVDVVHPNKMSVREKLREFVNP